MARYGVPYKGSKNAIAEWVVNTLPAGNRLVDLFAGGCAVTHCAMLSGKWNNYMANPVYISEYSMPEDRFECIAEKVRRGHLAANNNAEYKTERIYKVRR